MLDEVHLQRAYYDRTAADYDAMHGDGDDEHFRSLEWLSSIIAHRGFKSLLDIGAGTGRAIRYLQARHQMRYMGVEPVEALRQAGHAKGVNPDQLIEGDALALPFQRDSFDIVTEFGVLHHIKDHRKAVREMCRVANKGVLLSDSNNFGQGSRRSRWVKHAINAVGLWPAYDWLATRGKGYHVSEGDGIWYSYSLINDLPEIQKKFPKLYFLTTMPADGPDLYRNAQHLAVFATR